MKSLKLFLGTVLLAMAASAQDHRTLALFFDLSSMSAADQSRAQESAIQYIQQQMTASDSVAILTFTSELTVVQDFSSNRDLLIAAVRGLMPPIAGVASVSAVRELKTLQDAATLLEPVQGKKALIYFSANLARLDAADPGNADQLKAAINAATRANVAFYPIDTRALKQN